MTRRIEHRDASLGFSMVELLMAAFILGVGLLGLAALQTVAMRQAGGSRSKGTASYVAQSVLEAAVLEGQVSYTARANRQSMTMDRVFTQGIGPWLSTPYGGFNVEGIQVTDAAGAPLPQLDTRIPDPAKRTAIYTASWARRAYKGTAPDPDSPQSQEFVVNVSWVENQQTKWLTVSRFIRF